MGRGLVVRSLAGSGRGDLSQRGGWFSPKGEGRGEGERGARPVQRPSSGEFQFCVNSFLRLQGQFFHQRQFHTLTGLDRYCQ